MDIAKIRKKLKEGRQDAAKPVTEPEGVLERAEDFGHPPPERSEEQAEKRAVKTEEETVDSIVELLTFNLAKEEYAFKVGEIQEIVRPQRITRIPKAEPYLLGITSLRGKIIPVIDLKKMLSLEGKNEDDKKQKILILKGPKGPIGAVIDRVIGVIRPSVSKIVETPLHLPEAEMRFIEGVALVDGRFISIIRIEEAVNIL